MYCKSFCHIDKSFALLKLVYLLTHGALYTYVPIVSLHAMQSGVSLDQIAIVQATLPASAALGSQATGILADKVGNYKACLFAMMVISMATSAGFAPFATYASLLTTENDSSRLSNATVLTANDTADYPAPSNGGNAAMFGLFLMFRSLASFSASSALALLDSMTIAMTTQRKAEIGKQKLWGSIGQGIFPLISGALIDWFQSSNGYRSYAPGFFVASVVALLALGPIAVLNVQPHRPSTKILKGFTQLVKRANVTVYVLVFGFIGFSFRYMVSYDFIFLNSIDAPNYLQGLTVTISCVSGIISLQFSEVVLNKLGAPRTLVLALSTFSLRFFGYSLIRNPWLSLVFNVTDGLALPLAMISSNRFCSQNAPPELTATFTGAISFAYQSYGGVSGSVGGILIDNYGYRFAARLLGAIVGAIALSYLIMHQFYLRQFEMKQGNANNEETAETGNVNPALEHGEKDEEPGFEKNKEDEEPVYVESVHL